MTDRGRSKAWEEASVWAIRLHDVTTDLTDEQCQELTRWRQTPENERALLEHFALMDALSEVPREAFASVRGAAFSIYRYVAGAAAVVVIATLLISAIYNSPRSYETATGKTRAVALSDGSQVQLNTQTKVTWRRGWGVGARWATLQGEAFFKIAHDARRPFRLQLSGAEIVVVGTSFNVRSDAERIVLSVIEGQVIFRYRSTATGTVEKRVHRAETLIFDRVDQTAVVTTIAAGYTPPWLRHLVVAEGVPLPELARELSRYTSVPITVDDPRLFKEKIFGEIDVSNESSVARALSLYGPIEVKQSPVGITLHYRDLRDRQVTSPRVDRAPSSNTPESAQKPRL